MIKTFIIRFVTKFFPKIYWHVTEAKSNLKMNSQPKFMLILDCDTDLDIKVVTDVIESLRKAGVVPILAVPGELLLRGASVYRNIMNQGIEFINHGYFQHTTVDQARTNYVSSYFYNELSDIEIQEDIIKGHEILVQKFKYTPIAFRTPHFGTYSQPTNLGHIHSQLHKLNYQISSSSVPRYFLSKGYFWKSEQEIWEVPVSGCPSWPLGIPDSYNFRFAPGRNLNEHDYLQEISKLAKRLSVGRLRRVNLYVDPSQVYDWPEFFENIALFKNYCVPTTTAYIED